MRCVIVPGYKGFYWISFNYYGKIRVDKYGIIANFKEVRRNEGWVQIAVL